MPNLTVYDWEGVDLVTDPYQRSKGSLDRAQNVEFSRVQGRGAIRKRAGLSALNSSALSTPIRGAINVPLPGVNQRYIYSYSSGWLRTPVASPGTITTDQFSGSGAPSTAFSPVFTFGSYPVVQPQVRIGNKLFYLRKNNVTGQGQGVYVLDGTTHWEAATVPFDAVDFHPGPLFLHRGRLCAGFVTEVGGVRDVTYVYLIDPVTGATVQAGGTFAATEAPCCGVSYLGQLFLGTSRSGSTGRVMYLRDNGTTWTQERAAAASHAGYACIATYKGELFAGTFASAGTAAIIEKRTAAGTWSTSLTGVDAANGGTFNGMIVFNNELYAFYKSVAPGAAATVHKYDGSSWTTDFDMGAQSTGDVRGAGIIGADLYIVTNQTTGHGIWRRRSGSWAKVATYSAPTGYLYGA